MEGDYPIFQDGPYNSTPIISTYGYLTMIKRLVDSWKRWKNSLDFHLHK